MTCFFMVVFSIPFFIPSTYKAYLSELGPFCNMLDTIWADNPELYLTTITDFVEIQKSFPDYLVKIEAPEFSWVDPDLTDGKIWTIDQIKASFNKGTYSFVYNFHKTVSIYAGVEILAFVSILILLIAFVLVISSDVVKFVVYPLEAMFEKV